MRQRAIRRLHEAEGFSDLNAEKAQAAKEAFGKKLQVQVVELWHRDQPELFCQVCELLGLITYQIKGESKKVLTVSFAADRSVVVRISIPGRESDGVIDLLQKSGALDEVAVDRKESVE